MTTQELDALQALCDGAAPGPWTIKEETHEPFGHEFQIFYPDALENDLDPIAVLDLFCGQTDNAAFIAAARTAMPALIAEVRNLTREAEFLRTAYREKSALIRLLIDTQALAQTVAEGPFKDYYDRVAPLPNCNDCWSKDCEYRPRPGDQVRINCPLWRGQRPAKEDNQ